MGISLYTSRVILRILGIDDFGIYNLIGGIVVMFAFLNGALSRGTMRFLNVEIARGVVNKINKVFCVGLNVHAVVAIVVFILSETVGLWLINYKLNIPQERMPAANIVFQFSILTTIIDILRIPYNSIILAYEKMSFYAYLGILESFMKLIIVFLLVYFATFDHLIVYSILLFTVNLIINIVYFIYSRIYYKEETRLVMYKDYALFKDFLSFSGWNILGQIALVGSNQGVNIILNIFCGVFINAAAGIANQVNTAVYSFINNFQLAFNPQIVQTYALNEMEKHQKLVLVTSKLSLFLISILIIPVLAFPEFILHLWLGKDIPMYSVPFTQFILLNSAIDALIGPFWMSAGAVGKIKIYQTVISCFIFLNIPAAYLILYLGYSPIYVIAAKVIISLFTLIYRFYYANLTLKFASSEIKLYLKNIVYISIYLFLTFYINQFLSSNWYSFLIGSFVLETLFIFLIFFTGINSDERLSFKNLIYSKLYLNKYK